jgi:HAD superfamily hydrolase (TIGR01549 family)
VNPSRLAGDLGAFDGVTFDLFGTLVHLDQSCLPQLVVDGVPRPSVLAAAFARLLELRPGVDPAEALVAYFDSRRELVSRMQDESDREIAAHEHFDRCLRRLGIADESVARDLARSQMEATLRAATLADGASLLLETLRTQGCRLGLVSNLADPVGGRNIVSHLDLDGWFDAVVFSGDIGWRKPDRRMFDTALAEMAVAHDRAVHIGDELRADVWGAGRCGIRTAWVNPTGEPFEGDYPPRLTIRSLAAIMESRP